ncbi:ZIP-like iron-zinc transporter [Pterulicium gracile]|uniref:ZIP-like iron-zinc transporter n=1 Tax=Pterulicium gracile TaxID=1884261 RepID=A0A5C3QIW1_9AGAR|nr:ZIP-like iron-zinc transporter [Pterula gracilis]
MSTFSQCAGSNDTSTPDMGLRIASIFIAFIASFFGAGFPVFARSSSWIKMPGYVYDFAKYFGSGVIISTALVHLLADGVEGLSSECLSDAWSGYPWAITICMASVFMIFVMELVAMRWGMSKLKKLGIYPDLVHSHGLRAHPTHGPFSDLAAVSDKPDDAAGESNARDPESQTTPPAAHHDQRVQQLIGVAVLEFGLIFHSVFVGLTLAVTDNFTVLLVVIIFHQIFEGLGLGARLSTLQLSDNYKTIPLTGAVLYALSIAIGIAAGLGVRETYNPESATASIVSGVVNSFSAGVLLYTGLVELLAQEFLFDQEMSRASNGKLAYALVCVLLGAALMSLVGNWA